MATKQEKAVERAVARANKKGVMREEKHVLWLLVAIILFLLWLLFAQHNGWWPFSRPKLGSAFYTNISPEAPIPAAAASDVTTSGGSGSGDTTGSGGTSGGSGSTSGGGGTTTPPAGSGGGSILDFAAGVNVGSNKADISGQATGLDEGCSIIASVNASTGGKQEVCTYTQGDKIVTVTYLNDRVISASKSGF
ncbi:MAG TPA: hypothetical protein VF466_00950 [Candidatus Saccharimonadales bacterium]